MLSRIFVDRPIFAWVLAIIVMLAGVGAIMGINPLPLIIPCHRVVAGDGLGGYSGGADGQGLATKRWLLEFEGALPPTLF